MNQLNSLYQKIEVFSQGISPENQVLSHCKKGCARCCYTDISVFEIEAQNIRQWFSQMTSERQNEIKNIWKDERKKALDFHEETVSSCAFLRHESCSIYEARPLICRTQGLPLSFKHESESYLDICPLNESMLVQIAEKEILNLDLLNLILAKLEQEDAKGSERGRVRLESLFEEFN